MKRLVFLSLSILSIAGLHGGFYEESGNQGFYFFEDPKETEKSKQETPQTPEEAAEMIAEQKKELYNLRCLAILSPTTENLTRYISEQNRFIALSEQFAKKWEHLLFDTPDLGSGHFSGTSAVGIEVRRKTEETQKLQTLDALGENYFLLLFAEGGDPYSEEAAKILNQFSTVTHWETRAISINGLPTKAIPNPEKNQGLAEKYHITKAPTFLVINPETREGYPVGVGVLSVLELIDNIYKQAERHQLEAKQ